MQQSRWLFMLVLALLVGCSQSSDELLIREAKTQYDSLMEAPKEDFHEDVSSDIPIEDKRRWDMAYGQREIVELFRNLLDQYPDASPQARSRVELAEGLANKSYMSLKVLAERQVSNRDTPEWQEARDSLKQLTVLMSEWESN